MRISMKIATIVFLMLLVPEIHSQWRPINNHTGSGWLNSVFFSDDDHGWIAGDGGTILKFDSGLFNWNRVESGTTKSLRSIAFFNNEMGFSAGADGVLLYSSNRGNNWSNKSLGITNDLNKIFIYNESVAYIAGDNGLLLKTTNSGSNWFPVSTTSYTKDFLSVWFTSESIGFIGTDSSSLLKTTDGGATWTEIFFPVGAWDPDEINSIFFTDNMNGYIGGGYHSPGSSFMRKTTDGGQTWTSVNISAMIRSFYFVDPDNGVITGGENTWNRFLTVKQGSSLKTQIFHHEDYDIMSCFITPSGKGWAVGGGAAIFYTDDYSDNWRQIFYGTADTPEAIGASLDGNLFIGSERYNFTEPGEVVQKGYLNNRLFKDVTPYFGITGGGEDFRDLVIVDSIIGYYITNWGNVHKSTNGGYTWDYIFTPGDENAGLFFVSRNTGWIYKNEIHKTVNSGLTWTLQFTAPFDISDLRFVNPNTGYACGSDNSSNGKVIKTTDGGNNWTILTIPAVGHLTAVAFSGPDTGIVAGWGNTLLKTYDGGETWITVSSSLEINVVERYSDKPIIARNDNRLKIVNEKSKGVFKEIKVTSASNFLDADFKNNNAFAASDSGYVLVSTDYGNTWTKYLVGAEVLEVKYDGKNHAIARTSSNVYINEFLISIPVEMIAFSGYYSNEAVQLEWTTATEINNYGFEIQRKTENSWENIGFVEGNGTSSSTSNYIFIDNKLPSVDNISYRLKQMDFSGDFEYSSEINILLPGKNYVLEQNYPNPFNPSTVIRYHIPETQHVQIAVTDILGRVVKMLENSEKERGVYEIKLDISEIQLSSGVYFYTLTTSSYNSVKKMIVIK
jgi:photosystem II stability/assembly factor-like uncharacterized protein